MFKRRNLIIIPLLALGAGTFLAQGNSIYAYKQKEKQADKTESKEKQKEEYFFRSGEMSAPFMVGEGSYLGVYLEEVTSDRAKELNLAEDRGAIVMKVVEGSPAEAAGLKKNDVIVSFNGHRVESVREMQRMLSETPSGRNVSIEVIRAGSPQVLSATLSKQQGNIRILRREGNLDEDLLKRNEEAMKRAEDAHRRAVEELDRQSEKFGEPNAALAREFGDFNFVGPGAVWFVNRSRLGILAESLSDQLAEYFGVKDGRGVLVTEVREETPASKAGLKAGDVIIAIDDQKIAGVEDLVREISKRPEATVTLTIIRNHSEQSVPVTLEKRGLESPPPARAPRVKQVSDSL